MKRVWMPLDVGAYLRDTSRLSTLEHGAYLLLIMDYWVNGNLPKDDASLALIARVSLDDWKKMRPKLKKLFKKGWTHKRVEEELQKAAEISEKRRKNAELKWAIARANGHAIASAKAPANGMHRARAPARVTITKDNYIDSRIPPESSGEGVKISQELRSRLGLATDEARDLAGMEGGEA